MPWRHSWIALCAHLIAFSGLVHGDERPHPIPESLHGAWIAESVELNGERRLLVEGDELYDTEFVIHRGRLVMVSRGVGDTEAYHAAVMSNNSGEQIRIWDKRGDRHRGWIIYRLDGDKLILSILGGDDGHPPMDFATEKGSGQIVFTLKKAPDPDPSNIKPERIVGFGRP